MAASFKVKCSKCGFSFNGSQIKKHENVCNGSYIAPAPKLLVCKYCGKDFSAISIADKANHTRWCEKNPKHLYYINRAKFNPNLDGNSKAVKAMSSPEAREKARLKIIERHKEGRYNELYKKRTGVKGKPHTVETKEKLSNIRKKFLAENPDKHPWTKCEKSRSAPCELFKVFLTDNNIVWEEEVKLIKNRFFSCDIYLPEYDLIIEVNGNQHYNKDETLRYYYFNRRSIFLAEGFKVVEVKYNLIYNMEFKRSFLMFLEDRDLGIFGVYKKYLIY